MTPPTYQELVEALKRTEIQLAGLIGAASYQGRGGTLVACINDTRELLARAESAKLVGTYVWVPVSERLPDVSDAVMVACEEGIVPAIYDNHLGEWLYPGQSYDVPEVTHWAEPLQHPSALKRAE